MLNYDSNMLQKLLEKFLEVDNIFNAICSCIVQEVFGGTCVIVDAVCWK